MVRPINQPDIHVNTSYLRFFEKEQKRRRRAKLFRMAILASCVGLLIHFKDEVRLKLSEAAPGLASQLQLDTQAGNSIRPSTATCDPVFPGGGALHRDGIGNPFADLSDFDDLT